MSWFVSSARRGLRVRAQLRTSALVVGILALAASPSSCQSVIGIEDGTLLKKCTNESQHCGGECVGCRTRQQCTVDSDCLSKRCVASSCWPVATGPLAFDALPFPSTTNLSDRWF